MHYQRAPQAQHAKRFREFLHQLGRINPNHLCRSLRGIGEGTKQVEHCAQPQLTPRRLDIFHGRVHRWRKKKSNADFIQAGGDPHRS